MSMDKRLKIEIIKEQLIVVFIFLLKDATNGKIIF